MKIAIIAPPWSKLPTNDYTGIENVVSSLCEKLTETGQEVILFAPHGSTSAAELIEYPEDTSGINWNDAEGNLRYFFKNILENLDLYFPDNISQPVLNSSSTHH